VNERVTPVLDDLELRDAPCFLWDSARLRIVWANAAGLKVFAAETLFDLIDRPFHALEPGAARIAELGKELKSGSPRRELLSFPSTGRIDPIAVTCFLHSLADGRSGVLIIGERPPNDRAPGVAEGMAQAFSALPVAALLIEADDSVGQHNAAAEDFIGQRKVRTLADVLGDTAAAAEFAIRLRNAGSLSQVQTIDLPIGRRDVRIVGRILDDPTGDGKRFVITLEDVTERRALERSLSAKPKRISGGERKPAPPLRQEALHEPPAVAALASPRDEPSTAASPQKALASPTDTSAGATDEVPAIVRARFDSSGEAVLIVRHGELLHANEQALSLLGFESFAALKAQRDIAQLLQTAGPLVAVAGGDGASRELAVSKSEIPWLNGPAMQIRAALSPRSLSQVGNGATAPAPPRAEPPPETGNVPNYQPRDLGPPAAAEEGWRPDDRELRAILDTASDGIVMLDGQGKIRSFSAGAEALFGRLNADVMGQPFEELLTPETRKTFRDYLSALSDSGLASIFNDGREVEGVAGSGGKLPLFLTLTRFNAGRKGRAAADQPFCAVVRDITQWKKTEAELRQAKDEAERTSAQKSEFLARISHELRTPLNAILGFSEVMRLERFGRIQNEKYRSYVDDIHTSGGHLLSLINDLLDLSKVEAGRLELNFTSVDLSEVTDEAVRSLTEQAQQARVVLRNNLPADLPSVVADARSMRQIMLNLLSNAVKFTDPGGQVTVSAKLTKAGELVLKVKDTGVGMDEEELKSALEPFRRVTSDARGNIEGTGLGLPLTKALTEANRAAFAISSEPGKGTVVEITYPTTRVLAD
jgi:PAS domain S-box-containing protein